MPGPSTAEPAPRGPRILHVLASPRAEGTVKLARDWLATLEGTQEVLILQSEPAEMTGSLGRLARWMRVEKALPRGPGKFPWIVWRSWAACRVRRPDLVVCWPNGFAAFVLGGAWLAGVPRLVTHAGNPPSTTRFGRAHTAFTTRIVSLLGGRMICCSAYVAGEFERAAGGAARIVRMVANCAPVSEIRRQARIAAEARVDRSPRIIMVATLEAHKDHATLLRAMPNVIRAFPAARLWLVGDGALRGTLADLATSLGVGGAVEFLGAREDVPALLGRSDVFVLSATREEGFGTVLVEAMAAELPIVASDVPACREALAGGRWGRLVAPGDPGALAGAIVDSLRARRPAAHDERDRHLLQYEPARMIAAYLEAT